MKKIAILASGSGTNAEAICRYFSGRTDAGVALGVVNRKDCGARERMERFGVEVAWLGRDEWQPAAEGGCDGANLLRLLGTKDIDLIVLAGFLAMVPAPVIDAYRGRIINIHPSLLPRHGGKGMWGRHVHEAVLASGDAESGITIHEVSDVIDGGRILLQARCPVLSGDTPDTLARRVHSLEHFHYPRLIDSLLTGCPTENFEM